MLTFCRVTFVALGGFLGAIAGYLLAKYFVLTFGVTLHFAFPRQYSFDHVVAVSVSTGAWLCPLAAIACGGWAALQCVRFGRTPAQPE
jgi:hypothetical protein